MGVVVYGLFLSLTVTIISLSNPLLGPGIPMLTGSIFVGSLLLIRQYLKVRALELFALILGVGFFPGGILVYYAPMIASLYGWGIAVTLRLGLASLLFGSFCMLLSTFLFYEFFIIQKKKFFSLLALIASALALYIPLIPSGRGQFFAVYSPYEGMFFLGILVVYLCNIVSALSLWLRHSQDAYRNIFLVLCIYGVFTMAVVLLSRGWFDGVVGLLILPGTIYFHGKQIQHIYWG